MFSEYLETAKPTDDILEDWNEKEENNKPQANTFDNENKDSKEGNTNELMEQHEKEKQAEEAKAKINERYNVLSNWYPNWFQKTLSNIEKDGKETSNILNINFWKDEKGEKHFTLSISEEEKEKGKESKITSNIAWEFSNFQEKNDNNNNSNPQSNDTQNDNKISFPQINVYTFWESENLWHILTQFLWLNKNENQNNIQNPIRFINWTELQQQNTTQELIWLIDKNIMRSPINSVYGYIQRDQLKQREEQSNKIDNFRTYLCELQFTPQKDNEEMLKYINNPENFNNNENIQEYCDIVAALCILCRNYTIWEIIDLLDISDEEQKEKLKEPSLITWEFVIEYLSSLWDSEISVLINNKDKIIELGKNQNN